LLCAPALHAQSRATQARINKAIDRGTEYLRTLFRDEGVDYPQPRYTTGMTALAAWTLLEAGISADDPLIEKASQVLRRDLVNSTTTYNLATAILFLDRLDCAADEPLIAGMAVRLLAGQNARGGWTYVSSLANPADEARLQNYLAAVVRSRKQAERTKRPRIPAELPQQIRLLLTRVNNVGQDVPDGSNSQFAMLALWVARRHGLPVDGALLKAAQLLRKMQLADGGWPYQFIPGGLLRTTLVTMTCAGLLGIALEHGVAKKQKQDRAPLGDDAAANRGLKVVGDFLKSANPTQSFALVSPANFNYFLFSMERVAVIYDLKKIGDTDWYRWGAEKLVDSQSPSGRWAGAYGAADTCFALLFLKRANVAKDLTLDLKGIVREPAVTPKKKNERERDPFDLPKIGPKDKKPKAKPAAESEKEARDVPPCRDSRQVVEKLPQNGSQSRLGIKTEREVTPAQDLVGGRFGAARLQALRERTLVLA